MKRILTIITAIALALSFSMAAIAVEKKEKKAEVKKQQSAQAKDQKTAPTASESKKKYDSFVDTNKNGIDDRCENLKSKNESSAAKTTVSKKADKKPAPPAIKVEPKKEDPKDKKPK